MNRKFKLAALIAGGYLFIGVFRIYGAAQLSHYFLGDGQPLILSNKEILSRAISLVASACILFGITLFFTRKLYRAIDNHTGLFLKNPNPLAIFDIDTLHYLHANPTFLSVFGYTQNQIRFISIYFPEQVAKTVQQLMLQDSTNFAAMGVWEVLLHDGTFAKMQVWISLTQWNNKQRGLVRMLDVTKQHDYEHQLRNLNNDLEKQVELRTRELAEMNHELQAYNEELHATNEAAIQANELIQRSNSELSRVHAQLKTTSKQLLAQSEEKLNKVLASIREVVWTGHIQNNNLHIDFVNDAFEELTGIPVREAIGSVVPEEMLISKLRDLIHSNKILESGVYEIDEVVQGKHQKTGELKWHHHRCTIHVYAELNEVRMDGTMSDVTVQKLAEEQVLEQREMLQHLIDNLPLMIMLIDKNGVIQFINEPMIRLGFSDAQTKDFVGTSYTEYTKKTLRTQSEIDWNNNFMQTENVWVEIQAALPDGGTYYSSWMGVPTENGGRIHLGQDVNHTKKLEADLRQQRATLQTIVDNLPQFLLATDKHDKYRFFSKSYVKLYERFTGGGDVYAEVLGLDEKEFMTAAYQPQGEDTLAIAMHYLTTQGKPVEIPYKSNTGEMIYILWYRIALPSGGFLNAGQDVTAQKKLTQDLEQQREMLQTLIENLPLKIVFVDKHRNIKFINDNFMLLEANQYAGKSLEAFIKDAFDDEQAQQKSLSALSESHQWTDFPIVTPTGEEIHNTWLTIPLPDASFIAIGQDITLRKKSEAEKNRLLEQLITQNNDLLQFSYIASHNLRGPVASILGLINLLEYNPNVEGHREILTHIQNSMNNLDNVIRDINLILEFRNIEAHQNQQVYLEQLIVLVVESFRSQLDSCNIRISIEVNVAWVYTIQSYVYSILHNLISNAIKYRDLDKDSIIRVEAVQKNNELLITVHDNGKGIDLDRFKDKLFLLYQRFDFDVTGRGLGLFMAKTQAEALGGKLIVESKPGLGSSFTLVLPVVKNTLVTVEA